VGPGRGDGVGVIAHPAAILDNNVDRNDVARKQDTLDRADSVDDLLVDRDAGVRWIGTYAARRAIVIARAAGAVAFDDLLCFLVEIVGADAGSSQRAHLGEHGGSYTTGLAHSGDPFLVLYRNHE